MKFVAPLLLALSFITLTDPSGKQVHVAPAQVNAVEPPTNCAPGAESKILLGTGNTVCVKETPDEVVRLLSVGQ